MKKFSELPLSAQIQSNLAKKGFTDPTPVQALSIDAALAGRDIVATAQTGTGKTLAFVLPTLELLSQKPQTSGIRALILSPTRELALQIHDVFATMAAGSGIRMAAVVGGLNETSQLRSIRHGAQIVIATPGRLYDFMSRKLIDLTKVKVLVLDEADRMLDMGFLPTIKRIMEATPNTRQTLFFSATIESSVKHLVDSHIRNAVRIEVGSTTKPAEQVDLHYYEVDQDSKLGLLEKILRAEQGPVLVFSRTKHGADKLAKKLSVSGFKTSAIHGDRSQNQRNQSLRGFQEGYYQVLVATDVAARGIHVDGIAHVVNYDLPQVPEDFIHRVGRTGRAGARGIASTFATRSERSDVTKIERTLGIKMIRQQTPDVPREARKAGAVVEIAPAAARRHRPDTRKPFSFSNKPKRSFRRAV